MRKRITFSGHGHQRKEVRLFVDRIGPRCNVDCAKILTILWWLFTAVGRRRRTEILAREGGIIVRARTFRCSLNYAKRPLVRLTVYLENLNMARETVMVRSNACQFRSTF